MVVVYTDSITNRKKYIFNVLFFNVLGVECELTSDRERFAAFNGVKFAYGDFDEKNGAAVMPAFGLLDESGVHPQPTDEVAWNGYRLLFPVKDNVFLPCDIFSFSFYLVTRYEEWLDCYGRDEHGRFRIEDSVSYRLGFHRVPLVQVLAVAFAEKLKILFPEFEYRKPELKIVYTCDVDIAYKYKGKGAWRWLAGLLRSVLHGEFADTANFLKAALGKEVTDPFDVYENTKRFSEKYGVSVIHFLPTGKYGRFDKNISPENKMFKKLLDKIGAFSEIGLHPSYGSLGKRDELAKELKALELAKGQKVCKSRQHYLLFSFPETPRQLIAEGITDDYTLGWTNNVGFRCSVAVPYHFYDLLEECETALTFHPLIVMDVALARIPEGAAGAGAAFGEVAAAVREYGGEFIILNHNTQPPLFQMIVDKFDCTDIL